jgi:hypothetical protein
VKSGVAGLELELTVTFANDGGCPNIAAIAADGVALPEHVSSVLWRYLRDLKVADQLIEAAWDDAGRADETERVAAE